MRQRSILRNSHLDDRVVQVGAVAERKLEQGQPRTRREMNRVTRMESGLISRQAHQKQQARINARRYVERSTIFREHRVQGHQRLAVGTCQRAERALIGEAGKADPRRKRRQVRTEYTIDEHDARCIDPRQTRQQSAVGGGRCYRLLERRVGHGTQAGVFPRLFTPARCGAWQSCTAERIGRRETLSRIARQALAQPFEARQKAADAGLQRSGHAASASIPA